MRVLAAVVYDGHMISIRNNSSECQLWIDEVMCDSYRGIFAPKIEMGTKIGDIKIKVIVWFTALITIHANDERILKKFVL